MNIFALDADPIVAARHQHDKHVVKMVLESAQIISTVARSAGMTFDGQYKSTHAHHPCVLWASATSANFRWLCEHAWALANEYAHRFCRQHASLPVITRGAQAESLIVRAPMTDFAQAMPPKYRGADAVSAYRAYYAGEKTNNSPRWTARDIPWWLASKTGGVS